MKLTIYTIVKYRTSHYAGLEIQNLEIYRIYIQYTLNNDQ